MPRRAGSRNYKNDLLIPIIEQILPNGEYSWEAVALAYQEQSREPTKRDNDDIKRHWLRNLCKGMVKPTGQPGAANERTLRCISIERKILEKSHSGLVGIPDSDAEEKEAEDDEADGGVDTNRRLSPARASKTRANESIRSQLASSRVRTATVVDDQDIVNEWEAQRDDEDFDECLQRRGNPPDYVVDAYGRLQEALEGEVGSGDSPFSPSISQSVGSALKRAAETTPTIEKSAKDALARASSYIKAQKTKNSSNKNKERTSVAGTIAKMLDRMDSSTNESAMTAQMNMMMMRQLEEMNASMARRAREERRERKRERKRRKRARAKKRAKRQVQRAALEDMDDHGGKGAGFWSMSSDSISDSGESSSDSDQSSNYGKGQWRPRKKVTERENARGGEDVNRNDGVDDVEVVLDK